MRNKLEARTILGATTMILMVIAIIIKMVNEIPQLNVTVSFIVTLMCMPNMFFAKQMKDEKCLKIYMFCFILWGIMTVMETWPLIA